MHTIVAAHDVLKSCGRCWYAGCCAHKLQYRMYYLCALWLSVHILTIVHADCFYCACTLFVLLVHSFSIDCAQCTHSEGWARPPLPPLPPLSPSVPAHRHMAPLSTIVLCAFCLLLHIFPDQLPPCVRTSQSSVFTLVRVYLPYLLHVHYNHNQKFCTSIPSRSGMESAPQHAVCSKWINSGAGRAGLRMGESGLGFWEPGSVKKRSHCRRVI